MKTFKGLSKQGFIRELNDRFLENGWYRFYYEFNNGLCHIGYNIGLEIINSKTKTKSIPEHEIVCFMCVESIPNYDVIIKQFNSSNSIGIIGNDGYIIKDNFNSYRESIGLPKFTPYNFNKLKEKSGYKLTKNINSFNRLSSK
jgi:hypothetical protein